MEASEDLRPALTLGAKSGNTAVTTAQDQDGPDDAYPQQCIQAFNPIPIQGRSGYEREKFGSIDSRIQEYLELGEIDEPPLTEYVPSCVDDQLLSPEYFETNGEILVVCMTKLLEESFLVRRCRPDIMLSVNSLAREGPK